MNNQDNLLNSLKKFFSKNLEPTKMSRKKMFWLMGSVVFGIFLIMLGNVGNVGIAPSDPPEKNSTNQYQYSSDQKSLDTMMAKEEDVLSAKLQEMLESISGAGKVKVTVRLKTSTKETFALNTTSGNKTTTEEDQGGGHRTINESNDSNQLVITRDEKGEIPVVVMENASEVAGVLVVSSGAVSPKVKEKLFEAVQVALNVEPHKITVLMGH